MDLDNGFAPQGVNQVKDTQRRSSFPPSLGWVPILIALGAVIIVSAVAFLPQYGTHQIIGVSGNKGPDSGNGTDLPSGAAVPSGQGVVPGQGNTPGPQGSTPVKGGSAAGAGDCTHGKNAGPTDTGVTSLQIQIATTDVTTGIGAGFLGEAVQGMRAAISPVNTAGGICGRKIALESRNDGWDYNQGGQYISGFINSGVFALVGEPDSEGLEAAITNGIIDRAGIPVVGTDGMLKSQYSDPWVFPVAASTVTNMHIAADYAIKTLKAHKVGIVYDSKYKFGSEGAGAFVAQVKRETGGGSLGIQQGQDCSGGFCGVSPDATDYSSQVTAFNSYCTGSQKCDVVVMLLEPKPMETWMSDESNCGCSWYNHLMGGEPLFDDSLAENCAQSCAQMIVWTGYRPDIPPFDGQQAVYTFAHSLSSVCPSCDPHNEFTEGAYLGTELFIAACQKLGSNLTRKGVRDTLESETFDLGLTGQPLHFGTGKLHLSNVSMAGFDDNASGSFNGWGYLSTGFLQDPAPGQDLG